MNTQWLRGRGHLMLWRHLRIALAMVQTYGKAGP